MSNTLSYWIGAYLLFYWWLQWAVFTSCVSLKLNLEHQCYTCHCCCVLYAYNESAVHYANILHLLSLFCIGDFELSQLSCFGSSVGRALHLECVRCGFESHLSAAFTLEKVRLLSCVVLCCFLSQCPSIHVPEACMVPLISPRSEHLVMWADMVMCRPVSTAVISITTTIGSQ